MNTWGGNNPTADEAQATQHTDLKKKVKLAPWALEPFLVGVLSAAAAIRKLPHTSLTLVS